MQAYIFLHNIRIMLGLQIIDNNRWVVTDHLHIHRILYILENGTSTIIQLYNKYFIFNSHNIVILLYLT